VDEPRAFEVPIFRPDSNLIDLFVFFGRCGPQIGLRGGYRFEVVSRGRLLGLGCDEALTTDLPVRPPFTAHDAIQ
jgi:hypothetical protein